MARFSEIFAYLCAAIFIPVFIARVIVRAEWRTIRNACLFWYGLLVLVSVGMAGLEQGLGWFLIFTLFSIPALPVITLTLKLWSRIGYGGRGVTSPDSNRRLWSRFPVPRLTPAQWTVVALLLVGVLGFIYWQDQRDLQARADVLRSFFGISDQTRLSDLRSVSKSPSMTPRIEGTARLRMQELNAYAGNLEKSNLWQQAAPQYGGAPVELASTENIRWRDLPIPAKVGNRHVRWSKLTDGGAVAKLRQGRVLCIALQRKQLARQNVHSSGPIPRFAARDCSELSPTEGWDRIVLGALDFDTGALHMIID